MPLGFALGSLLLLLVLLLLGLLHLMGGAFQEVTDFSILAAGLNSLGNIVHDFLELLLGKAGGF